MAPTDKKIIRKFLSDWVNSEESRIGKYSLQEWVKRNKEKLYDFLAFQWHGDLENRDPEVFERRQKRIEISIGDDREIEIEPHQPEPEFKEEIEICL